MSIVKRSNLFPSSSFFDDFLMRDLFDWSGWANEGGSVPRANIVETNDDFRVDIAAPGMKKDDFLQYIRSSQTISKTQKIKTLFAESIIFSLSKEHSTCQIQWKLKKSKQPTRMGFWVWSFLRRKKPRKGHPERYQFLNHLYLTWVGFRSMRGVNIRPINYRFSIFIYGLWKSLYQNHQFSGIEIIQLRDIYKLMDSGWTQNN